MISIFSFKNCFTSEYLIHHWELNNDIKTSNWLDISFKHASNKPSEIDFILRKNCWKYCIQSYSFFVEECRESKIKKVTNIKKLPIKFHNANSTDLNFRILFSFSFPLNYWFFSIFYHIFLQQKIDQNKSSMHFYFEK